MLTNDRLWFLHRGFEGLHRHCATKCSSWSSVASKECVFLSLCQMSGRNSSFSAFFPPYKVIQMHAPATCVQIRIKSVEGTSVGKHQCLWFAQWRAARQHFDDSLFFPEVRSCAAATCMAWRKTIMHDIIRHVKNRINLQCHRTIQPAHPSCQARIESVFSLSGTE